MTYNLKKDLEATSRNIGRLSLYKTTEEYKKLSLFQKYLIYKQIKALKKYAFILISREGNHD